MIHQLAPRKEDCDEEGKSNENGKKLSHAPHGKLQSFQNKLTDLEHVAEELSTAETKHSILFTPKFHCELAGEGIECSWGVAKRFYRKQALSAKKSVAQFVSLVKKSMSRVNMQMVRRFAHKARGCVLAHKHMRKLERDENTAGKDSRSEVSIKVENSYENTEKIRKTYYSHRDANVIDGSFIESVVKECVTLE